MARSTATLVVTALVFASACSTGPGPEQEQGPAGPPHPAPSIPTAGAPRSSGIAITPDHLRDADPCALLNPEALARYGKATIDMGTQFTSCDATIGLATGDTAVIGVGFDFDVPTGSTPRDRDGVTVYDDEGDEHWCRQTVVVSDHAVITWAAGVRGSVTGNRALGCEIARTAVDGTLPRLKSGELEPAGLPPNSLGRLDACRLLDHRETARVPGIDQSRLHPGFNGQSCTWGDPEVSSAGVLVTFSRTAEPRADSPRDRRTTINDRSAVVHPVVGGSNPDHRTLPGCQVQIVHRPLDDPGGVQAVEDVSVQVTADAPDESSCPLAIELATAAVNRLPPG